MALPNIFTQSVSETIIARINTLQPSTPSLWGKMNVSQMLAHCNVPYEMTFDNIHPRPNVVLRFILKMVAKSQVVTEKPYPKSGQTAPQFVITGDRDFDEEKKRLIGYIQKSQSLGESHFEQKEHAAFGAMSKIEWNNLFYKHLDHHLGQFGA
jgi:Protein of unknown function (DUF1569)